jgi:hypothetical protein
MSRPQPNSTPRGLLALACLLAVALAGCSPLNLPKDFHWPGSKPKTVTPSRMTDMWTYTVMRQPGQQGVRGFGGRIMFYRSEDEKPVCVEGTLTVFAFDAAENDPARAVPLRKFVFLPEQLSAHYSESKLGHSYSFWLPWDEVGGPESALSLIARFESKGGTVLTGAPSRQTLAGPRTEGGPDQTAKQTAPPAARRNAGTVQLAGHQEAAATPAPTSPITTMTLDVPPNFMRSAAATPAGAQPGAPLLLPSVPQSVGVRTSADRQEPAVGDSALAGSAQGPTATTRSAPTRFPARRAPAFAPATDPVRRQPFRAGSLSNLPTTPRWASAAPDASTTPAAASASSPNGLPPVESSQSRP